MEAEAESAGHRGVIFIEDFIDVFLSRAAVQECFGHAEKWLTDLASVSEKEGEATLLQVGPSWAGGLMSRGVEVTVGPTRDRGEALVVPLTWKATSSADFFPVLNGDLELASLDSQHCRVTLAASYVPPFGEVGRALDRALLHLIAQSTIRSFLAKLATSLELGDGDHASQDATHRQKQLH